MIKFISRLFISLLAILTSVGFGAGFGIDSFFVIGIFLCTWVIIVPLEDIFAWILFVAVVFGILHYDHGGFYIFGIIIVVFIFDLLLEQAKKTANDSSFILYSIAFLTTLCIKKVLELIIFHNIAFNFHLFFMSLVMTIPLFFITKFFITRIERFVSLYTYGSDMRSHT